MTTKHAEPGGVIWTIRIPATGEMS